LADAELVHLPDTPGPGEIEAVIEAEAAIEEMQASPMEIEAEPAIIEFERTVSGLDTPLALTDPPAEYGAAMETSSGEEEPALDESTTETPQPSRLDAPS
jgi:hypothetical protein